MRGDLLFVIALNNSWNISRLEREYEYGRKKEEREKL